MKKININLAVIEVVKSNGRFNYELGYKANGSFGATENNIVSLADAFDSDSEFKKGDCVSVSCSAVQPIFENGSFKVNFTDTEIVGKSENKTVSSTGSIIRDADYNGILKAEDSVIADLHKHGIIKRAILRDARVEMIGDTANVDMIFPFCKDAEKQIVYGVVYEPYTGDNSDTQGDYATAAEIEKAAHGFMKEYQQVGLMHETMLPIKKAVIVESYIAPADFNLFGQEIKKGSWVIGTHILDKDLWNMVKKGELTGYSMGGTGKSSDFLKSDSYKSITKKCLYDMQIKEVSLVDKGANRKRFFLMKKDNTVTKEELIEALASDELVTKISDKIVKSLDIKKAEADAAKIEADKVAATAAKAEADKLAAEKKPAQYYIDNPEVEVPEDMLAEVIALSTGK